MNDVQIKTKTNYEKCHFSFYLPKSHKSFSRKKQLGTHLLYYRQLSRYFFVHNRILFNHISFDAEMNVKKIANLMTQTLDMMIEMKMLKVSNMKKLLSSFKLGVDLDTRDDYIRF